MTIQRLPSDALEQSVNMRRRVVEVVNQITQAPTWIAPTLLNSWVNYGNGIVGDAGYYKDALGRVHIKGVIKDGTATASTVLFQLPAGYRPGHEVVCNVRASNTTESAEGAARVDIETDGDVVIIGGDVSGFGTGCYVSLDGISFLAEQ